MLVAIAHNASRTRPGAGKDRENQGGQDPYHNNDHE